MKNPYILLLLCLIFSKGLSQESNQITTKYTANNKGNFSSIGAEIEIRTLNQILILRGQIMILHCMM